jgi:chromate reductase
VTAGGRVRVLLVSGSTRRASTNGAVLRTVAGLVPDGVDTTLYAGIAGLPAFTTDAGDDLPPPVLELSQAVSAADAVLFCVPEYAGTLPGSFKNALDWMVGTGDFYGKPVAWLNVAAANRGEGAIATLRLVTGYLGAVVIEHACVHVPIDRAMIGSDAIVHDSGARAQFGQVMSQIRDHVRAAGPS